MSNSSDELVDREDLLLGPGRPAEQREVVHQRLADEALRDVVRDRGLALALAHLGAVRVEDQRQVRERRHRVAEGAEQQDVLGRVREMVLAADHVADLHRRVVDDDREVVERRAVAADDDEVAAEVRDVDLDAAADDVVEGDDPLPDAEPQGADPALRLARGALLGRQRRAPADVARRQPGRLLRRAVGVELLGGAVAGVRLVVGEQPARGLRIERQPLHLAVRRDAARGPPRRRPPGPRPSAAPASAGRRGCPSRRRACRAPGPCPRGGGRTCRPRGGRTGS